MGKSGRDVPFQSRSFATQRQPRQRKTKHTISPCLDELPPLSAFARLLKPTLSRVEWQPRLGDRGSYSNKNKLKSRGVLKQGKDNGF